MKALKLAVAEPSAILRCGIIAVLRRLPAPDVDILEIADISQLTAQLSRHRPDVLVVNPASLGFCTPQQLRVQTGCEGLRCIALQMSVTDAATLNAYDDVLSVYDPVETLREKIMQPVGDAPREERQEPLSAREREIVVCIVKGMTNKQIADALAAAEGIPGQVSAAQAAAEQAASSASAAAGSATAAASSASTASTAAGQAQTAATNAGQSETNAATSASDAEDAKTTAETAAGSASADAAAAESAKTAAQTAATNAENAAAPVLAILSSGAGAHNSIYRGKNLGTSVTAAQWAAIADGSFTDLYIGDYWVIDGVNWRIAAFDYYYKTGDTPCITHHVVIVPDTILYNAAMNSTDTTTGGYVGSAMYTANLEQAKTIIKTAFGSAHVITKRELLTTAVNGNTPSGWAWFDSEVELMNEVQVYGSVAWGAHDGNGYNVASDDGQFPLFVFDRTKLHNRENYWLRDVSSATIFSLVDGSGNASRFVASGSFGVRPVFAIIG